MYIKKKERKVDRRMGERDKRDEREGKSTYKKIRERE